MRTWSYVMAGGLLLAFMSPIGGIATATAEEYPWCAYYGSSGDGGGTNCGFVTREQCMATVSGIGGFCGENPQYRPHTAAPRKVTQRHDRSRKSRTE